MRSETGTLRNVTNPLFPPPSRLVVRMRRLLCVAVVTNYRFVVLVPLSSVNPLPTGGTYPSLAVAGNDDG
jgi:hypothetical protein